MSTFYVRVLLTVCALVFFCMSEMRADDLQGLVAERNALDPKLRIQFDHDNELRQQRAIDAANGRLRSDLIVRSSLKWPTNSTVSVCFFDGRAEAREHVVEVAQRWTQGSSLQLDFGPVGNRATCDATKPSNIRVSLRGLGNWSYIGMQAEEINANKATLSLQDMDKTSFTDYDDGIILHEFGHAIGFEHEHQGRVVNCEQEWDLNYFYTELRWSEKQIKQNLRRLSLPSRKSELLTTAFDRQSVMLYLLPRQAFKNPDTTPCFIPQPNNALSELDRWAVQQVYPIGPDHREVLRPIEQ